MRNAAARPASSVAAVAIRSGLPSMGPATTKAMPHFTKVLESAAMTMAIDGNVGLAGLGELRHGQGDGVDIGQTGKRRHRRRGRRGEMLLHDLDGEQNHGEHRRELRCGGQAERILHCELARWRFEPLRQSRRGSRAALRTRRPRPPSPRRERALGQAARG